MKCKICFFKCHYNLNSASNLQSSTIFLLHSFRLEVLWEQEMKLKPDDPSLLRTVFRFIKTRLLAACAVFLFCLIFGFIGPTCFIRGLGLCFIRIFRHFSGLVSFTENPSLNDDGSIYYTYGLLLVLAISLVQIFLFFFSFS